MAKHSGILDFNINKNMSAYDMIRLVIRLSIPAIMAQISSIIMQYIDAAMVGSLGAHASASIGLVSTTTWLIGGLCISVSTGFSVQVAQLIGANEPEKARSVFRQSIIVALIFGILATVVCILISPHLPIWLGGAEDIIHDSSRYFLIYACTLIFMQLRQLSGSMLQCSGDMRTPSILIIALCTLDVIFNFIFIFPTRAVSVFGTSLTVPGAGMGVAGAAMGTALAEICTSVLMFLSAAVRSDKLAFRLGGDWKLSRKCLHTAAKISLPSALEHTITCGAYLAVTLIVAPLGTVSIAANSLAITAESFCYMPGYGIGSAATTLVGQSIGAKRRDLAKRFSHYSVGLGVAMMTITGIVMFIFSPGIFSLLTPSAEVRELGAALLKIEAFAEPLYAASIVCAGALRGAGDTFIPAVLNLVSMWGIRIVLAVILVPHVGLYGVWIAMCIELCMRGILFLIRLLRGRWLDKEINYG